MKVIDDKNLSEGAVAALVTWGDGQNNLIFKVKGSGNAYVLYFDNSAGPTEWDEELNANQVLKFYYPGDRITIEV